MNPTNTFQPTLLQKLLGKHYKWWYLIKYQIKKNTAYRVSTFIWMLGRLTVLFTTVFIWWVNVQAGSNLYNFSYIFTYYIFGSLISIGNGVQWQVAGAIKSGGLSSLLLSPTPVMPKVILADFSWWLFPTFIETLILITVAVVGWQYIIVASPMNFVLYLLCGIIGYFIGAFFAYILGSLAFFLTDASGVLELQNQANYFLAGKAIPLNVNIFLQPLIFLPFSFTFYHPMQIYLGKYTPIETLYVFLGGIAWCIILYLLAKLVFRLGLKKNEAVGL
jgi:ABC-2 type transport system permease protein